VGRVDEDGPEDVHVLAGARLDVLVQDVDAPSCSSPRSQNTDGWIAWNEAATKEKTSASWNKNDRGGGVDGGLAGHVLLLCAECMRIQSFLSGEKSDRIHAAMAGRAACCGCCFALLAWRADAGRVKSLDLKSAPQLNLLALFLHSLPPTTAPPLLIVTLPPSRCRVAVRPYLLRPHTPTRINKRARARDCGSLSLEKTKRQAWSLVGLPRRHHHINNSKRPRCSSADRSMPRWTPASSLVYFAS
jgi:hypothetical protein